jgi:putative sterol carrier protein
LLSEEWLAAWRGEIARSEMSSADWSTVLRFNADPAAGMNEARAVFIRFEDGKLAETKLATDADVERAQFLISGSPKTWKQIFDGKADPVVALMMGRLDLEKGGMGRLGPHVKAAKALLAAANKVPTRFPGEMSS